MRKICLLLTAIVLSACSSGASQDETTNSVQSSVTSVESKPALLFEFGESYQFEETDIQAFSVGQVGLKMSVDKVEFDETIDLKLGYPEEQHSKFEDKVPVVVTATFENPTEEYIDLIGFDVIDAEGRVLEFTFVSDVSSVTVDGINAGQKIVQTFVYLGHDTQAVQVNYAGATWQ